MAYIKSKHKSFRDFVLLKFDIFSIYNLLLALSIFFVLAIVPLLVKYAGGIAMSPEEVYMLRYPQTSADIFSYNKSLSVKYATILMGIIFSLDFYQRNFAKSPKSRSHSALSAVNLDSAAAFTWKDYAKHPAIISYVIFFAFSFIGMLVNNKANFGVFGINEANSILFSVPLYFFVFSPLAFIITGKAKSSINKPIAASCLIFFACVIVTTVFTRFKYLAFNGANQRFESIYAVLGYIIILLSVIRFADSDRKIKIVLIGLIISAAVLGLIAVFQMRGLDFFSTDLAAKLFYGKHYREGAKFNVHFTESAYSLLYNPNNLGLYASMTTAFFVFSFIFIPWRNLYKAIFSILAAISAAALYASRSSSGLISIIITISAGILLVIVFCLKTQRNVVPLFISGATAVVIAATAYLLVPNISERISYMVDKLFASGSSSPNNFLLNLKAADNEVELVVSAGSIKLKYILDEQKAEVRFNEEPAEPYSVSEPDQNGVINQMYNLPGVGDYMVSYANNLVSFSLHGYSYNFYADAANDGKLYQLTSMGIPRDINEEVPSLGFSGNEMFANGRGYIWSRTIPLLKNTLIKGYGVDSFVVSFPQYDIVGKTRFAGNPHLIIDKAHNGYLQIAVSTGVISMLAVLFLFAYYIYRGVKSIISHNNEDRFIFALKFGLVTAVLAYAITFLSTDSNVSTSPMFWGFLGLGIAVTQFSEALGSMDISKNNTQSPTSLKPKQ